MNKRFGDSGKEEPPDEPGVGRCGYLPWLVGGESGC